MSIAVQLKNMVNISLSVTNAGRNSVIVVVQKENNVQNAGEGI